MKKIINQASAIVEETLDGFAELHSERVARVPGTHMIERRRQKQPGRVRFMMGNGAGHEPAVIGWVGPGMFDLNVAGEIFTAPSAQDILAGIERLAASGPVLLAVQNHAGDVLNANKAMELALRKGLSVKSVLFYDDIASAPKGHEQERRGMAGMLFYTKIVGAAAERGYDVDRLVPLFERCRDQTRTYAVAITNCTNPITGLGMFDHLGPDEIELGLGVHGDSSGNVVKLPSASGLARLMLDAIHEDFPLKRGDDLLVFVNGAGGTTMMELCIYYRELKRRLTELGIRVRGVKAGNYLTTQELSGVSLSLCRVDREMMDLWSDPCDVAAF
ncbi:MAG TPA: dihydroxyacetone kinase subunit DhaK [Spirochaetia bacterium]|nr:dihydroxyacetone kinase subunit DhaK [Spirochaetia bacterium]